MQEFPPLPPVADAPDGLFEGHLWLVEHVAGAPLRFALEETGWLAFGDGDRVFRGDVPVEYRFAVRHVRERIDRDALGEVPAGAVFFGVATRYAGIEYDWDRLPPVLGTEVWSPAREAFLPPDAAERAFERLALDPANALEKEVAARHFSLDAYDPPDSAWYDGPPAGVVIRNKRGGRALLSVRDAAADPPGASPEELAGRYAGADRIESAIDAAREAGGDYDEVRRRVVDAVLREEYANLVSRDRPADLGAVVGAIEERVRAHLADSGIDPG